MTDHEACTFKKTSRSRKNIRKRQRSDDEVEDDDIGAFVKDRKKRTGVLSQSTKDFKKAYEHPGAIKSTRSVCASGTADQDATRTLDVDTATDRDHRAITERSKKSAELDPKVYRGMAAHSMSHLIKKREETTVNKAHAIGPVRQATNVRQSCRFDYQPDICKDYKETGVCGYGDNCKFMHDRGDYKSGWQLEKEWQEEQEKKRMIASGLIEPDSEPSSDESGEELPFACFICREDFVNPVSTKCAHYFCEKCAMEHHRKSKRCFVCNEQTFGIFNTAQRLHEKIEQKKARQAEKEERKRKYKEDAINQAKNQTGIAD
eukprot:Rmarinus@m.19723